jgi:hypothetical protein
MPMVSFAIYVYHYFQVLLFEYDLYYACMNDSDSVVGVAVLSYLC